MAGEHRASSALLGAAAIVAVGFGCRASRETPPLSTAAAALPEVTSPFNGTAEDEQVVRAVDEQVVRAVEQTLTRELGSAEAGKVSVNVEQGVVLLSGTADTSPAKRAALAAAETAPGARAVVDQLSVEVPRPFTAAVASPPLSPRPRGPDVPRAGDAEIASALEDAMSYDPRVGRSEVKAEVSRGVVTLRGDPPTLVAARAAVEDAEHTVGVGRVENNMRVLPPPPTSDDEIALRVRLAFDHDRLVDLRNLDLTAADGQVLIHGRVPGQLAHARAVALASAVPGVVSVGDGVVVAGPGPGPAPGDRR